MSHHTTATLSIRVFGESVDPTEVSVALAATPSEAHRKGDPIFVRSKGGEALRRGVHVQGVWVMKADLASAPPLEQQLAWAETFVAGRAAAFDMFRARGYSYDLFVGVFLQRTQMGVCIDLAEYPTLFRQRFKIELDIYA